MIKSTEINTNGEDSFIEKTNDFVKILAPTSIKNLVRSSKSSVIIYADTLEASLVNSLNQLSPNELNIKLLFNIIDNEDRIQILQQLIHQHKLVNNTKKLEKEKNSNKFLFLTLMFLSSSLASLGMFLANFSDKINMVSNSIYLIFGLISLFLCYYSWKKKIISNREEIYAYQYSMNIFFKCLKGFTIQEKYSNYILCIVDSKNVYLLNYGQDFSNTVSLKQITNDDEIRSIVDQISDETKKDYSKNQNEVTTLGKEVYAENKL